ncbi:MAG: TonB-dependent receptor, partial [Acidobacteria bacterium]|nr:TonB-dependent receptor [Acidobacteriota bacterium]
MLDDVVTLTPTMVLNTRLNWTRFAEVHLLPSTGMDITAMGFPSFLAAASPLLILPRVDLGAFGQLGESNANTTPFDSFQIFSNMVKVVNRHSLKIGADIRRYRESNYQPQNSSGRYQFSTNWTRGPLDSASSAPVGQDLASFLLGLPTGGSFDLTAFRSNQSGYFALFLQDDYRVRNNLTLNLGLRFEKELPTTERFNRMVGGFDLAAANGVTAAAKAAYARAPILELPVSAFNPVGGMLFASPDRRSAYSMSSTNFSPRFGFAWTPAALGGKTVIRGGGGVFYFDFGISGTDQTGFSQSTALVATQDGYVTPYSTLSNPFPDGLQQPLGSKLGLDTYLGRGVGFFNPEPLTPYTVRWNLNVQRLLTNNLVMEIGYLYNHSIHLGVDRQINFAPRQFFSTTGRRDQAAIDFLSGNVTNPFSGLIPGTNLSGTVVTRQQLLKPRAQFTDITAQAESEGSSYAHMLLARIDKRFSGGLQLQANFQYSRVMQKLDRLNDSDPFLAKRVASTDRPLRAVVSGLYGLPLGRGKRFLGGSGGFLNQVVGGWTVSGAFVSQSGPPLEWGNVIYLGGDLNMQPANIDGAFNTTRFNTDSKQQLGSNLRTFPATFANLRAAGVVNVDLAAIKDFPIRERLKLQYRCEFFNAANHPLFDVPDNSPTSSTFGKIQIQVNQPRRIQMALKVVW